MYILIMFEYCNCLL